MTNKEIVHYGKHTAMGCGPIESCALCKTKAMGDAPPQYMIPFIGLTAQDVRKYMVIGLITALSGGIAVEYILHRHLFKRKK